MPHRIWHVSATDDLGVPRRVRCEVLDVAGIEVLKLETFGGIPLKRVDRGHYRDPKDHEYLSRDGDAP